MRTTDQDLAIIRGLDLAKCLPSRFAEILKGVIEDVEDLRHEQLATIPAPPLTEPNNEMPEKPLTFEDASYYAAEVPEECNDDLGNFDSPEDALVAFFEAHVLNHPDSDIDTIDIHAFKREVLTDVNVNKWVEKLLEELTDEFQYHYGVAMSVEEAKAAGIEDDLAPAIATLRQPFKALIRKALQNVATHTSNRITTKTYPLGEARALVRVEKPELFGNPRQLELPLIQPRANLRLVR